MTSATPYAVETEDLTKRYGPKTAVDGLRLQVAEGELFGFLGPNGAGKTTTIRMLTTVIHPTAGTARVRGFDILKNPLEVRRQLAVIPQIGTLAVHLNAYENIRIYLLFHGLPRVEARRRTEEALDRFGLCEVAHLRPTQLSSGQRRRVQIARVLMSSAPMLFLDEPTVGLDPVARLEVWSRIREMRASGTTIFLTTQTMEEAEALCTRVGIIFNGRIRLDLPAYELKTRMGATRVQIMVEGLRPPQLEAVLSEWKATATVQIVRVQLPLLEAVVDGDYLQVARMAQTVAGLGGRVLRMEVRPPSLEDVYLSVVRSDGP